MIWREGYKLSSRIRWEVRGILSVLCWNPHSVTVWPLWACFCHRKINNIKYAAWYPVCTGNEYRGLLFFPLPDASDTTPCCFAYISRPLPRAHLQEYFYTSSKCSIPAVVWVSVLQNPLGGWGRCTFCCRASPPRSPLRGCPIHSHPFSSCINRHCSSFSSFRFPSYHMQGLDKVFLEDTPHSNGD